MRCPICGQTCRDEDALLLMDDAFGNAVVYHIRAEDRINPIAGVNATKSICAKAGFRLPFTENAAASSVEPKETSE